MAHRTRKEELDATINDIHREIDELRTALFEFFRTQMRDMAVIDSQIFSMKRLVNELPDEIDAG